jgi:hypothetical protein
MGLTPRSVKDQEEARSKFHSSAKTGSRAESSGGADLPRKLDAFFDESRWGRHRNAPPMATSSPRLAVPSKRYTPSSVGVSTKDPTSSFFRINRAALTLRA